MGETDTHREIHKESSGRLPHSPCKPRLPEEPETEKRRGFSVCTSVGCGTQVGFFSCLGKGTG